MDARGDRSRLAFPTGTAMAFRNGTKVTGGVIPVIFALINWGLAGKSEAS